MKSTFLVGFFFGSAIVVCVLEPRKMIGGIEFLRLCVNSRNAHTTTHPLMANKIILAFVSTHFHSVGRFCCLIFILEYYITQYVWVSHFRCRPDLHRSTRPQINFYLFLSIRPLQCDAIPDTRRILDWLHMWFYWREIAWQLTGTHQHSQWSYVRIRSRSVTVNLRRVCGARYVFLRRV